MKFKDWMANTAIGAVAATLVMAAGAWATILPSQESAQFPGGEGTFTGTQNANAFSHPLANLSFGDRAEFNIGDSIFSRAWVTPPATTRSSDGLGPLFNARACQDCHQKDGRGHPPEGNFPQDTAVSMLLRLSVPPWSEDQHRALASGAIMAVPDPVYGFQLQDHAVASLPIEGRIHLTYEESTVDLAGGETVSLRRPIPSITDLGYGPHADDLLMSLRIAPAMIGLGLLEAIPDERLMALADPDDTDGDGISGRIHWLGDETDGPLQLGRFGWKAEQPTLNDQNLAAFSGDIGMSSTLKPDPWGDCTQAQSLCRDAPHGISDSEPVEIQPRLAEAMLFYTRTLAVPARPDFDDPMVLAGGDIFQSIGCASCHTPNHVTRPDAALPVLSSQVIWPYTDLLLHDMGEGLADHRPIGRANGQEWRTAPLWGIGLTQTVSGHTFFLHDGRARNLTEAILWHGGEADAAREAFRSLPPEDRERLLTFLGSL